MKRVRRKSEGSVGVADLVTPQKKTINSRVFKPRVLAPLAVLLSLVVIGLVKPLASSGESATTLNPTAARCSLTRSLGSVIPNLGLPNLAGNLIDTANLGPCGPDGGRIAFASTVTAIGRST